MKGNSRKQDAKTQGMHHEGHKLKTRRDFLAQGFSTGAAMVAGPSLLGLMASSGVEAAEDCGIAVGGAGNIPFVCFDLAGGANIAGSNVMVGGPGGQMDLLSAEGYSKLGLPSDMLPQLSGQVSSELGIAFHSDSAFLRGIISKTSSATRGRVNGTVICAQSDNDTGNNPHNPMYGISKAGADGDLVTLIGTESSESGGRSRAPMSMIDPSLRPTRVVRPSDAMGLVDTGKLVDLLSTQDAGAVMRAIERISDQKVALLNESDIVRDLISCAYAQSSDLVSRYGDPQVLDPLQDPDITGQSDSIFPGNEVYGNDFRKTAAVMKLVANGFAGAGTVQLGGYDYHDSTRATGELKDYSAGQCMGGVLEYAARIGQPIVVYVFSDGSVSSDGNIDNSQNGRGKGIWKGDNSSTAAALMLVYNPAGRPQMTGPTANQLGHFRANGSVETSAIRAAANVDILAETIVANYLALHDDVGRLSEILPNHGLGSGIDLEKVIAFQPI